jgi:hypothetical protein
VRYEVYNLGYLLILEMNRGSGVGLLFWAGRRAEGWFQYMVLVGTMGYCCF